MDLAQETLSIIKEFKHEAADVLYVSAFHGVRGPPTYCLERAMWTFEEFMEAAQGVIYPNTVRDDLLVVGDGWWLARDHLDGEACWRFFSPPIKPTIKGSNIEALSVTLDESESSEE